MWVKKQFIISCLCLLAFSVNGSVNISGQGYSRIFHVALDSIMREKVNVGGVIYEKVFIDGFSNINNEGMPSLPVYNVLMAIPKNAKIEISLLDKGVTDTLCGVRILPAPLLSNDGEFEYLNYKEKFNCLNSSLYPCQNFQVVERFNYLGVEIVKLQISPLQYNSVSRKVIVNKNYKISVNFVGGSVNKEAPIFGNKAEIIKGLVLNGDEYVRQFDNSKSRVLRDERKVLIITHSNFKPAADSLALWQRMKGYDVTVVSDTSWVVKDKNRPKALVKEKTDIVKKIVKDFYNTNGGSGYLLIMGGWWFVPNELLFSGVWTDQCYTAMSSNLIYGNMPRGRIACETIDEAMRSVRKIIQYETSPSMDPDFYRSFLTAAMFEGSHDNGYSEKRFAKTAEEIFKYLEDEQGYNKGERVFSCNYTPSASHHPTNWNDGVYANGGVLPSHLQWPGFRWDGTKSDVSASINRGKFMVLYRGHGQPTNWSAFNFHINDIQSLANKGKYPIVFSVTCNTGKFDRNVYNPAWDLICFAQEFLQAENSGAAGVFGAAQSSFSGPNDALAHALVDAIWPNPGTSCVKPNYQMKEEGARREPIYTLGDIALYGLGRMAVDWNTGDLPMQKNLVMYHYFGDPTTKIIVKVPKILTASCAQSVPDMSSGFTVSNINCSSGVATLVNVSSGKLLGKTNISGSSIEIPVSGQFSGSDVLALTLTSDGYKPFIKELNGEVGWQEQMSGVNNRKAILSVCGSKVKFIMPRLSKAEIKVFDIRGRIVYEKKLSDFYGVFSVDFEDEKISSGSYVISLKVGAEKQFKKINIMK